MPPITALKNQEATGKGVHGDEVGRDYFHYHDLGEAINKNWGWRSVMPPVRAFRTPY
jgi:hypothetical protein